MAPQLTEKTCKTCNATFPIDNFYAFVTKGIQCYTAHCKECYKARVRNNRAEKREQYSEYEKTRFSRPERKVQRMDNQRRHRAKNPDKNRARARLGYAVRTGKISKPETCDRCGAECIAEAHHHDYSKPLEVVWLCFSCHREAGHGQVVIDKTFRMLMEGKDLNN